MKSPLATAFAATALSLIIAGCSSTPAPTAPAAQPAKVSTAPAKPAAAPVAQAPAPEAKVQPAPEIPAVAAPEAEPETPTKVSPEALAVVERLTQTVGPDTLPHELSDTTGFPEALKSLERGAHAPKLEVVDTVNQPPPTGLTADGSSTQLIERDWTGLVLVPISASLAKAYTSEVRLLKVEAHPLNDGRVRIWTRIHNISNRTLPGQVACQFRMRGQSLPTSPYFYHLEVPPHSHRDVFFISPDGELSSYTVLVRSEDMTQRK
ncbi:MAG: hypothetical protein QM790_00025 [Nibricoccus sp.]